MEEKKKGGRKGNDQEGGKTWGKYRTLDNNTENRSSYFHYPNS